MTPSVSPWLARFPSVQVRDLDPRGHALIEASAGTGKTFAIERLVLRLLVENPSWNPEELLVLSFTEKTVAELRDRIRRLLRAQIDGSDPKNRIEGWSNEDLACIRKAWLHADDLSIHTLHAFCQSAVRRDPIANNALIRTELTEDWGVADFTLDGLLRGTWATDSDRLEKLSGALGICGSDEWRKKLIRLALAYQPWRGDVIDPACDQGTVEPLEAEAAAMVLELPGAIAAIDAGSFPIAEFRKAAVLTKTGRPAANGEENLRRHAYEKVFRFREESQMGEEETLRFFVKGFRKDSKAVKNGWASEIPSGGQGLPEWERLADICASLRRLGEELEEARRQRDLGLLAEAARELRKALDAEKLRRGLISYDDMPRRLVEALRRNEKLAPRLRARYKACIVDEFQDTDPIQWEILQQLCLQESPKDTPAGEKSPQSSPALPDSGQTPKTHHSLSPSLPLFLVGDPKQAIYAFRGGDLRTYMRARNTFLGLAERGQAQGVGLDANYRSRPALIQALNTLFAHADWFGEPPEIPADPVWHLPGTTDGIAFTPVHAGRRDDTSGGGPAIVLREFSEVAIDSKGKAVPPKKKDVEQAVRAWIVARIVEAVRDGTRPGDFAVLTRGNPEGESIARLLLRRGVPCRIRRKHGPFHGPQADALRLLLEWIEDAADPDAQARILLLPFARRNGTDLPKGRPDRCPPLIARWAALAQSGRWPEFFTSVLHEGGYRERLASVSHADAARFDRLTQILSEAGASPGVSAHALCERFDALRRGDEAFDADEGDDGAKTEDGAVSVMTLHLSKGLEFPHVFIAATGSGGKNDFLVLRDPDASGFRIALDAQDEDHATQAAREAREEDKRLYYVAFTRAKESLHVPLLPEKFNRAEPGPLGGFAATALRTLADTPETETLVRRDEDPVEEVRIAMESGMHDREDEETPDRETLLADARAAFARRRRLTSYSSLAHHAGSMSVIARDLENADSTAEPLLEEDGSRVQRQEPVPETPAEDNDPLKVSTAVPAHLGISAEELPPGAAAGTALHALLEHTPFASVLEADSPEAWLELPGNRARIEETLRRESVDTACAPAAASAVWNALRAPIPDPAIATAKDSAPSTFRLADIAQGDLRHEVEFLLPFSTASGNTDLPEGVTRKGPFLWGFIDLVFRKDGRYYLLDWKSNLLPFYDDASVLRSMDQHRYHLQWKLYAVALDRWLRARLRDYDPETHFGGVCYLYLRGAGPERFSGFTQRPRAQDLLEGYPREIHALLGAREDS